jgi:IclR family KDG regulon transcriptional repressor
VKSESNQKYRLGPKILGLAAILLSKTDLRAIALPYMDELKRKTGETVNLFILEGDCRICIERVESPQGIRMVSNIGEPIPLPAGAVGKLFLAYLPEKKRKELMQRVHLTQVTPKTITCKKELEKEVQKIREQGFAKSFQERVPLAASLSAPIRNYTGEVIAALSLGGPVMRFTPQRVREYVISVKETAHKISRELGYQG